MIACNVEGSPGLRRGALVEFGRVRSNARETGGPVIRFNEFENIDGDVVFLHVLGHERQYVRGKEKETLVREDEEK